MAVLVFGPLIAAKLIGGVGPVVGAAARVVRRSG
jgi:type IV secretory pathway TrbL component